LATAGIVLGWVGVGLTAAGIVLGVIAFAIGNTQKAGPDFSGACATEKSTIITADEAYKAQNGFYTDTEGLVGGGLLKSTPAYYTIDANGFVATTPTGDSNGCT